MKHGQKKHQVRTIVSYKGYPTEDLQFRVRMV